MGSEMHIVILVNPASGGGKGLKLANELKSELLQREIHFDFFSDEWPVTLTDFSDVWLVGGDGTVNFFINKYPGLQIPLAIFKGGTGNDFAWKLYGDISLTTQIELVLSAENKKVDLGCCNGRRYANSLGLGFDGEVLRSMKMIRWLGGHLGYLFVVVRKIFSFKEFSFKVDIAGKTFNEKYLLVIANNSTRTGGGFMVSPKAALTDGLLDLVFCKKLSVWRRLQYLPVIEKGKHLELPFIYYLQEKAVTIECEKEIFGQMDGELITGKAFDIVVIRNALSVKY